MKALNQYILEARKSVKNRPYGDDPKYEPPYSVKTTRDLALVIGVYLENYGDETKKFIKILGKTIYDKGSGYRTIRNGQIHDANSNTYTFFYLANTYTGDYLEFKYKPTQDSLDKCLKILKDDLEKEGFFVDLEFYNKDHNDYWQHEDTYAVGIKITVSKKSVKKYIEHTSKLKNN